MARTICGAREAAGFFIEVVDHPPRIGRPNGQSAALELRSNVPVRTAGLPSFVICDPPRRARHPIEPANLLNLKVPLSSGLVYLTDLHPRCSEAVFVDPYRPTS